MCLTRTRSPVRYASSCAGRLLRRVGKRNRSLEQGFDRDSGRLARRAVDQADVGRIEQAGTLRGRAQRAGLSRGAHLVLLMQADAGSSTAGQRTAQIAAVVASNGNVATLSRNSATLPRYWVKGQSGQRTSTARCWTPSKPMCGGILRWSRRWCRRCRPSAPLKLPGSSDPYLKDDRRLQGDLRGRCFANRAAYDVFTRPRP